MMFIQVNPNPMKRSTGDCVVRALSILFDKSWDEVYLTLCVYGFMLKDWGNKDAVWERYLYDQGYKKDIIPNICPDCYTIKRFCEESNGKGRFLLACGQHVAAVIDGTLYDSWDSSNEVPIYYYWRDEPMKFR